MSNKTYRTFNPETNSENEWLFHQASEEEIEEAVQIASEAFSHYRNLSGKRRFEFLIAIGEEIMNLGDDLLEVFCLESGLPMSRAKIERDRTIHQLHSYGAHVALDTWPPTTVSICDDGPNLRKTRIPLGPVVVFGSSNFPFAYSTAGGDTASALAAGCPVIVKSHPMHAGTGEMVASAIIKAAERTNMPDGVFSNLNAIGYTVGEQLVRSPQIMAVGFTGSINGGRALFDIANSRPEPIPVYAEMGSVNPIIFSPGTLAERMDHWVKTFVTSMTTGTGQFCTNPGLMLGIDSKDLDTFGAELGEALIDQPSTCMLHPNIRSSFDRLKTEILDQEGVQKVAEAKGEIGANYARQAVVKVTGDYFEKNPKLHHEVFGPFSLIVACRDEDQLIRIIQALEGQLTGTINCEQDEGDFAACIVEHLKYRVGRIIYNGVPTGVEVVDAMHHGGPYPATTDAHFTAVGVHAIDRWVRPVAYQNFPVELLPGELKG